MTRFLTAAAIAGAVTLGAAAEAAVIRTIDLLPIDGTSFSDVTTTGVALDFGTSGKGRLTFSSLTPGTGFGSPPLVRIGFVNGATLDNGNTFVSNNELVFDLRGSNASFVITVSLDAGVLPTGSVFEIRSLDRDDDDAQYFKPGAGMGAVDSHQLDSDGSVPLVEGAGGEFLPDGDGISRGRVWDVGGVNSFSGTFRQDRQFGGVAITIAVPEVTAPATLALLLAGIGAMGGLRRARRPS